MENQSSSSSGSQSSESGGGACALTPLNPKAPPATTTVSFANDVLPILEMQCGQANSACHGLGLSPKLSGRPWLGNTGGAQTAAADVLKGIVMVPAVEDPKLYEVAPGDSAHSFIVIKTNNQQDMYLSDCSACGSDPYTGLKDCGVAMPQSLPPIPADQLQTIATWIDEGAQNN
ncbi:MAG: hypothetical protein FWD17_01795 [Polyangiaceae bacterium]|nr:hypothetical protein [Polyangiaceae bacterium]